ncbi:membrane protein [Rugamonas sp. R1(2021)]|jgi:uncharacterized membrane protein
MKINMKRILRHAVLTHWQVERAFPPSALAAIEQEIKTSEAAHLGEIRFAVEGGLPASLLYRDQSARERAIDMFSLLRIWDTDERNGVLIYLLLADHSVEIVADRGVHAKTGAPEWERICRGMETAFRGGRYEQGVIDGIQAITRLLTTYFPSHGARRNELPDKVVLL